MLSENSETPENEKEFERVDVRILGRLPISSKCGIRVKGK